MGKDIDTINYLHWWTSLRPCSCGIQPKVRYVREKQGTDGWRASFYWLVECPKCGKQVTSAVSQTALFSWNGQN